MTQPKKLDSYDPAYGEMFRRVAEEGEIFTLDCETHGRAVYLTQKLRGYRKLLIEESAKRKELIEQARNARLVEVAIEGYNVLVRPTGGSWDSKLLNNALARGLEKALPETSPQATDEPPAGPKTHGYY